MQENSEKINGYHRRAIRLCVLPFIRYILHRCAVNA